MKKRPGLSAQEFQMLVAVGLEKRTVLVPFPSEAAAIAARAKFYISRKYHMAQHPEDAVWMDPVTLCLRQGKDGGWFLRFEHQDETLLEELYATALNNTAPPIQKSPLKMKTAEEIDSTFQPPGYKAFEQLYGTADEKEEKEDT